MDQIFRIGKFLKPARVSVRMLRYYGQEGLLKPEQIDPFTDHRLYSADQVPSLNHILFLRDLGFDVSRVREALKHWDQTFILDLLEQKRLETQDRIRAEQIRLLDIEQAERDLFKNIISVNYNVSIKAAPRCGMLSLRRVMPGHCEEGVLWEGMSLYAGKHGISISDHTFTIYHDMDYRERDTDTGICTPVSELREDGEELTYRMAEAIFYVTDIMVRGPFGSISGVYRGFAPWIQRHNQYRMIG